MSKPNLIQFGTAVGFYRNPRVRELYDRLKKEIPRKVDFAELAPMLFQVVMSAAAENQIDGDFASYNANRWCEIFLANHVQVTLKEASLIRVLFKDIGLFEGDKIRSWAKFNRHLADYEGIVKAKRRAGKLSAKRREQDARSALKGGRKNDEISASEPEKSASENGSASKQLWLIEKGLEKAKGKARRELLVKKERLLSGELGVDLSEPAPAARPPAPKAQKETPGGWQRTLLSSARQLLADSPELLTEKMVIALANARAKFPEDVYQRFRKVLDGLAEKEAGDNPVPG
ncbi:MAG TPA: hypothetical protein VG146_01720 [Verrucomicrobiae bacterium]|nr:hypothetical protein [Verrucomicrobiae bacterium]